MNRGVEVCEVDKNMGSSTRFRFMVRFIRSTRAICGVSLLMLSGCLGSPPAPDMPSFDADGSAEAAITQYDANQDGKLDAKEMEKSAALSAAAAELDTTGDKALDSAELTARMQSYVEGGVARKMFSAQVLFDGVPLAGAEVKFVPEDFMLGAIKEGVGITDAGGTVTITEPNVDPPGISVGFYRIVVSKKDAAGKETLPAKFNAATTLGMEVPAFTMIRTSGTPVIHLKR